MEITLRTRQSNPTRLLTALLVTASLCSAACVDEQSLENTTPAEEADPAIDSTSSALVGAIDTYRVGALEISILQATSDYEAHPTVHVPVPPGYRLLGGGARVNWNGAGNLLTGMWPEQSAWVASSKDHLVSSPATITAQAIVARMADGQPIGDDDYIVVESNSVPAQHPQATAILPAGFVLVGGGARDNWSGAGNLLTASFPSGNGWFASGKDHGVASPATVTAFAIGVRESFLQAHGLRLQQRAITSLATNWPSVTCSLDFGYRLLSGGARANWTGAGQLLTSSAFSDRHSWTASSKDHLYADPGTVTAYCIGVSI